MSTKKPQKRLVGWKRYLTTAGRKGAGYSLALVFGFGGFPVLLLGIIVLCAGAYVTLCDWSSGFLILLWGGTLTGSRSAVGNGLFGGTGNTA